MNRGKNWLAYAVNHLRREMQSSCKEVIIPFDCSPDDDGLIKTIPLAGDNPKLLDLAFKNALYLREERQAGKTKTRKIKCQPAHPGYIERRLPVCRKDLIISSALTTATSRSSPVAKLCGVQECKA